VFGLVEAADEGFADFLSAAGFAAGFLLGTKLAPIL